jgi:hypothetical protein
MQVIQCFPNCALRIPRYLLPLTKGSVDTFLNDFFYVYSFIEGIFVKNNLKTYLMDDTFILDDP